ncbi:NADPH2:quinone reductase [Nakamurella panacisegetis]|uniref:NADPH2:quinone reductase n=1 Tax=Nakamurella panacisegetis TaxID=1090615 RepID=A0A1H0QZ00_9ACTN|nr:quinone oxidoreductase [Nakamurella panacisegetis]SDP22006.1 NADPH2:quinone reductase [Nakamurella panacisegetis]
MTVAISVQRAGGPEVLQIAEVDLPAPGPGQALLEVAAAGVNFIDIYRRSGVYPVEYPYTPGHEGAGRVLAVGPGVTLVEVGDRVAWCDVPGSYAARTVGAVDRLIPVPDPVDDQQAAAFPLQGLTAHYLATDSYRIQPGDTVLIHAGAGGAGLLLTQIAKIKGATVITTVSTPAKAELSRRAGADHVLVGYDGFAGQVRDLTGGAGVQAVYDGVGKDTFDGSMDALARRGTLVLFGGSSGQVPPVDPQRLNRGGSLSLTRPTLGDFTATREELLARADDLLTWIADGRLHITVGATYPLADAGRAQEDLAARRTTGKLLLIP